MEILEENKSCTMFTYVHWSLPASQAAEKLWNSKFWVVSWRLLMVAAWARLARAVTAIMNFILSK